MASLKAPSLATALFVATYCAAASAEPAIDERPVPVEAQLPESPTFWGPRNNVSWNPLRASMDGSLLNLEVERAFLPELTAFVGLGAWSNRWNASPGEGGSGSIELGARFFPGREAPRGFFLEALLSARAASWLMGTGTSTTADGEVLHTRVTGQSSVLSAGLMLGYTWIPWRRLVLSLGAGGTYSQLGQYQLHETESRDRPIRFEFTTTTLLPVLRGAVGYAF